MLNVSHLAMTSLPSLAKIIAKVSFNDSLTSISMLFIYQRKAVVAQNILVVEFWYGGHTISLRPLMAELNILG